jgi:hypothetical protein
MKRRGLFDPDPPPGLLRPVSFAEYASQQPTVAPRKGLFSRALTKVGRKLDPNDPERLGDALRTAWEMVGPAALMMSGPGELIAGHMAYEGIKQNRPVEAGLGLLGASPLLGVGLRGARRLGEAGHALVPGGLMGKGPFPVYSRLTRAVADAPFEVAPAEQWAGYLRKQPVSQNEKAWVGVDDFLGTRVGQKLTKSEVLGEVEGKGIRLKETVLGEVEAGEVVGPLVTGGPPTWGVRDPRTGEIVATYSARSEAEASARSLRRRSPKFGSYTEPGGENYREILVQLDKPRPSAPAIDRVVSDPPGYRVDTERPAQGLPYYSYRGEGVSSRVFESQADARAAAWSQYDSHRRWGMPDPADLADFTTPHFDEPNVLAHIRANDRVYKNPVTGKNEKVLFLEEIQSDWQGKGRAQGYRGADTRPPELRSAMEASTSSQEQLAAAESALSRGEVPLEQVEALESAHRANLREVSRIARETGYQPDKLGAVPDQPFKSADEWVELSLKRALAEAEAGGYDRVAWVNGDISAKRYDLSKQVSRIEYTDGGDLMAYDHSGTRVIHEVNVPSEKVADYIGKGPAERLMAKRQAGEDMVASAKARVREITLEKKRVFRAQSTGVERGDFSPELQELERQRQTALKQVRDASNRGPRGKSDVSIEGLDLKVGGEKHKALYDQILPKVARKYTKGLGGGDVEPINMRFGEKRTRSLTVEEYEPNIFRVLEPDGNPLDHEFNTRAAAEGYIADQGTTGGSQQVLSIPVTPKLRAGLSKGQRVLGTAGLLGLGATAEAKRREQMALLQDNYWGVR